MVDRADLLVDPPGDFDLGVRVRPLQESTIDIAGQHLVAEPQIPAEAQHIIDEVTH